MTYQHGSSSSREMEALDLEELPSGRVSRVLIHLVDDGLGGPVHIPVLVAKGEKPGPVFGLTAALHGNELNGIPVIHRLFEEVDPRKLRGTLVGVVVVNVPSFRRHQRRFVDGRDLNKLFPGTKDGKTSSIYVHRVIDRIVSRFDYLLDLHTASFGRINSLYVRADMGHPTAARMAHLIRPAIILHNPASDLTLRGAAGELGIPAITIEIGNPQVFQPRHVKPTLIGIRAMLAEAGMLRKRPAHTRSSPVLCERSFWIYTDRGGLLDVLPKVTQQLAAGEIIARQTDVFGELICEYRAPEDGIVIGKSTNPVGHTGARIVHLGVLAGEDDPRRRVPVAEPPGDDPTG